MKCQDAFPSEAASLEPPSTYRRAKRQINPSKECPLGRVVIYCKDLIVILPCMYLPLRQMVFDS